MRGDLSSSTGGSAPRALNALPCVCGYFALHGRCSSFADHAAALTTTPLCGRDRGDWWRPFEVCGRERGRGASGGAPDLSKEEVTELFKRLKHVLDESEAFGDFAARVGQPALAAFAADYVCTSAVAK